MKVVQKKISLEQFKSRMPSVIPAYDENGVYHMFCQMIDLLNEPLVNYNMLPFDVQVEKNANLGKYSNQIFSYKALVTIFHELDSIYNNIFLNSCAEEKTLTEEESNFYQWLCKKCFPFFVFDIELVNNSDLQKIKSYWAVSRLSIQDVGTWIKKMETLKKSQDCCDMDEYQYRGGDKVFDALTAWYYKAKERIVCYGDECLYDMVYDVKDEDDIVEVKVLKENANGFKTIVLYQFTIYEPKVKVLGENRYIQYGELDEKNVVKNKKEIEIIDNKLIIPPLVTINDNILIIQEPSFVLPLLLTNSMSNLGEAVSICEPWEMGYEYNENKKDQPYYSGGTIVYYNGDNWILKSYDSPGYLYSTKYREMYFANIQGMRDDEYINFSDNNIIQCGDEEKNVNEDNIDSLNNENSSDNAFFNQWQRYFDYLEKINKNIYTYSYKNDNLVLNPTPLIMADTYEINTNNGLGYSLYNDKLYNIIECDYLTYKDKMYEVFYVYEDKKNNIKLNPYININNERIYINKKSPLVKEIKTISSECGQHNFTSANTLFRYAGILKETETKIDGYITYNNEQIYFQHINNSFSALSNSIGEKKEEKDIEVNDKNTLWYITYQENIEGQIKHYVKISSPYTEYDGKYVSGYTSSKINEMICELKMATDELGNVLQGLMPYKTFYGQINNDDPTSIVSFDDYDVTLKPNDWLSLPYIPKYVSQLSEMNQKTEEGELLLWGNIIDKVIITFEVTLTNKNIIDSFDSSSLILPLQNTLIDSYVTQDSEGKIVQENKYRYTFSYNCESNVALKEVEKIMQQHATIIENISLQVQYYMGTIIKKNENEYDLFGKDNDNNYYGVKYIDNFTLEKAQGLCYENDINAYIVNYWLMRPYTVTYTNQTYNVPNIVEETSFFEFIIKPFEISYGYIDNEGNNDTFYKVNEISETVTYKGQEYPIQFHGSHKYFTVNGKIFYIKLYLITTEETTDKYFDYKNDMSLSPIIFHENKLGHASLENVKDDIYIDRGTVRAMDYHLRLLESKTLESLEQIGNGFFKFNSNNEIN